MAPETLPHGLHPDILDEREPVSRAFLAALTLHVTLIAGMGIYGWMSTHSESFGAQNAGGGAIGIEAVKSIPLQHSGPQNPVANDTESQVLQQPAKPIEQAKEEKVSPNAVALKMKQKRRLADVASEKQRFRPFKEIDKNQVFAKQAPQVSNPLFSAMPGSGRIGTGANTTLGTRFAGYGQQIQNLVAQKWHTNDVDARVQTAPVVIASFDLMRDGRIRNLRVVQQSGISALDYSVQRAILEASPFPPLPPGFDRDSAQVEFTFELKR
ncbi:MAG: TonB family protein [Acidobacteriota bacterium]